ncbi:threonyl-tRNA synthetase editing domain-containing protein [Marinilabiliaceae bacterium ANBcel2]|nr:threonyl-tRNA synthetase editing domain-containing protein [Marinilabiliaceae bacterium ANBcel2]
MKVLCFYTSEFSFETGEASNEKVAEKAESAKYQNCITAFIQAEESDEEYDLKSREKKLANHLKWVARNNKTKTVVLHSFAHLSSSKASMEFTKKLLNATQKRLKNGDYKTYQTPFGYFLNFNMMAPGFSMARIFAEL